jgi:hypothetical protein
MPAANVRRTAPARPEPAPPDVAHEPAPPDAAFTVDPNKASPYPPRPPRADALMPATHLDAATLRLRLLAAVLSGTLVASGCAIIGRFDEHSADRAELGSSPTSLPPARTVTLEVRSVRHALDDPQMTVELWAEADEQAIPRAVRERLAANGLRAGIIAWPLPPSLAERFAVEPAVTRDLEATPSHDPLLPDVSRQTLKLLPARESEIVAMSTTEELVVLERGEGRIHGTTYRNATPLFELTAEAAADGKTDVELIPVITHGEQRRDWIGEEGVFRLEAGQQRKRLETLRFAVDLGDDAMLVVTAAGDPSSSVGDAFLRGGEQPRRPQKTLAIRPLSRSVDPVFTAAGAEAADEAAMPGGF